MRARLNDVPIAIAGVLWFFPTTAFWIRFVPALRPWHFETQAPDWLTVMGCACICALPYVLPRAYFCPQRFERPGLYRALGIRVFRLLAPDGDLINRKLRGIDAGYRVSSDKSALRTYIRNTYSNERAHLALFLFGCFTAAFAIATRDGVLALAMSTGNVIFNLYPVMNQRYKRARLRRFLRML